MAIPHPSTQFEAPSSIKTGSCLGDLYSPHTIWLIGESFRDVLPGFDLDKFTSEAVDKSRDLPFKNKTYQIGAVLRGHLPTDSKAALKALGQSLGPKLNRTEGNGLQPMFYMPHSHLLASFADTNDDEIFDISVDLNFDLTTRFTAEFSIRPFIEARTRRTLQLLSKRSNDPNPHVRRLISEGTRPRLPWASHLYIIRKDPELTMPFLEALKSDDCRYVTRSVANHLGDIGKDNLDLMLGTCERWIVESETGNLTEASSKELRWVIRHALRHPAKKGHTIANILRIKAH
jgi:3-methyladenine DNA glycosylase AlkC